MKTVSLKHWGILILTVFFIAVLCFHFIAVDNSKTLSDNRSCHDEENIRDKSLEKFPKEKPAKPAFTPTKKVTKIITIDNLNLHQKGVLRRKFSAEELADNNQYFFPITKLIWVDDENIVFYGGGELRHKSAYLFSYNIKNLKMNWELIIPDYSINDICSFDDELFLMSVSDNRKLKNYLWFVDITSGKIVNKITDDSIKQRLKVNYVRFDDIFSVDKKIGFHLDEKKKNNIFLLDVAEDKISPCGGIKGDPQFQVSENDKYIVAYASLDLIRIFDIASGKIKFYQGEFYGTLIDAPYNSSVFYDGDDKIVFGVSCCWSDSKIYCINLYGENIFEINRYHKRIEMDVNFTKGIIAFSDCLYSTEGEEIAETPRSPRKIEHAIKLSPDATKLAVAGIDSKVHVYEISDL